MLRNYFKVTLRYLRQHPSYSIINMLGLAVGIACCLLMLLFVQSEFSYDKLHHNSSRIYRAWVREKNPGQQDILDIVTPLPLGPALQSSFPEIESSCRINNFTALVKIGTSSFNEDFRMVDSSFFHLFDFQLLEGDRNHPFPNNNSILLTPVTAKKYFGTGDALGKSLELQLGNEKVPFIVSGIVAEAPEESSIKYHALLSFANAPLLFNPNAFHSWFNVNSETYVLLKKDTKVADMENKFPSMIKQNLGENYKEGAYTVHLQPITQIHLDSSLPAGIEPISNPKYSYILLTIGILILFIACINFITLSVGRSTARSMEVGVRKVLGAERKQLLIQFLGEALMITFISLLIGLVLCYLVLPIFNEISDRRLTIHADIQFLGYCFGILFLVAILAGSYPALLLSGFRPVEIFKRKITIGSNTGLLRKSLIVGQFITSIGLIVCTIIINAQMHFLLHKDLGYHKEQVIVVPTNQSLQKGMQLGNLYRNELIRQGYVRDASVSVMSFLETPWVGMGYTDDAHTYRNFQFNAVDPFFIKTMGLQLVEGRDFSLDNPSDLMHSMIINEALAKEYGWKQAIGKKLPGRMDQQVIGVVRDFNYESLHTPVKPLVMVIRPDSIIRQVQDINYNAPLQPRVTIRLKTADIADQLSKLKQVWKSVAGEQEFEFHFLDESVAQQYIKEERTSSVMNFAAALSVFIACMGLFGLVSLLIAKKTREIGIRKVLGASVQHIVFFLSREFTWLILLSSVIAFPLAWWAMKSWMQDFAYQISMPWWAFPLAAASALIIAWITLSIQTIKTALSNPVNSLRTE